MFVDRVHLFKEAVQRVKDQHPFQINENLDYVALHQGYIFS
jgi:hypothetical protein